MYIFLSEVHLVEEEEYANYLRMTPECFDKLFVLGMSGIAKETTNMRDVSAPKLNLVAFLVHSFVVSLSFFVVIFKKN